MEEAESLQAPERPAEMREVNRGLASRPDRKPARGRLPPPCGDTNTPASEWQVRNTPLVDATGRRLTYDAVNQARRLSKVSQEPRINTPYHLGHG